MFHLHEIGTSVPQYYIEKHTFTNDNEYWLRETQILKLFHLLVKNMGLRAILSSNISHSAPQDVPIFMEWAAVCLSSTQKEFQLANENWHEISETRILLFLKFSLKRGHFWAILLLWVHHKMLSSFWNFNQVHQQYTEKINLQIRLGIK